MARKPRSTADPSTAIPLADAAQADRPEDAPEDAPYLEVRAIDGRWRCGLRFGPAPTRLSRADIAAAAAAKGLTVQEVLRALCADPALSIQSIA